MAQVADKRAKLDLQVNVIAEQELTGLLGMVVDIHKHLGLKTEDEEEVQRMKEPTSLADLTGIIEEVERHIDERAASGPRSAADTEA
jgi:hypothetical protein